MLPNEKQPARQMNRVRARNHVRQIYDDGTPLPTLDEIFAKVTEDSNAYRRYVQDQSWSRLWPMPNKRRRDSAAPPEGGKIAAVYRLLLRGASVEEVAYEAKEENWIDAVALIRSIHHTYGYGIRWEPTEAKLYLT
jgi:hypothetical protein